jgi:hypothetical protein
MKKVKLFEQYLAEVTKQMIDGTSGRTITVLDNRKYELKKDVKDARIGDYVNVVLPKGTIITNLPGGVFANHDDLKQKYCIGYKSQRWDDKFGVAIRTMPDTLTAIEKDSKVLESLDEATTSWKKMMAGVKTSESGPWSLVAIENKKVVAQKNDIKIQDMIPAHFEAMRKEYPKAAIHIEDGTGMVVWNESLNEALVGDKLTKQFTKETGIAVWDKVSLKSESGIWTVVRLWAPKDDGGMNPGLHIELTKGNSREHFQVMDDNSNLTQFGKEIKKNI